MAPRTSLLLVRHGRVANPNHVVYGDLPGFDLDAVGVLQAHATARHLEACGVELVASSPLQRAITTATAIADRIGADLVVDDGLTEWDLNPAWTGRRWDELPRALPGQLEAYLETPHDLPFAHEPLAGLADRMQAAVDRHLGTRDGPLIVVSHQDPIAALTLALTGAPLSRLLESPPPHASITRLVRTGRTWRLMGRWEPPAVAPEDDPRPDTIPAPTPQM